MIKQVFTAIVVATASGIASADVLVTKNGERLLGELESIRGDSLVWASDSFSTLTLSKSDIAELVLTQAININGHDEPCYMDSFVDGMMRLNCEGTESFVHLDMLQSLEPWIDPDYEYFSWTGNIRLTGELFWGNKTDKDWTLDSATSVYKGDFRHTGALYYKRDDNSDPLAESDIKWIASYSLDWFYNEHWYLNSNTEARRDDTDSIDSRYTFGVGIGYRFWDDDTGHLFIENGPVYVKETLDESGLKTTTSSTGWRYKFDWFTPFPIWSEELGAAPDFYHTHTVTMTDTDNLRTQIESNTGLRFPVFGSINADFDFEADYDDMPSEGNQKTDYQLRLGISYTW
ncbi:DUF481 domain-containing protein [uncultured Umboniibacter sp.]|uniref:DUF481 domain-containing protein n=1 Tax=uncultured Umboniibacter sp. TaxID=1798917 RepID=UPI00262E6C07|nr:DUF481 domain-containing protein [uncultured Umboniibacter sp.]